MSWGLKRKVCFDTQPRSLPELEQLQKELGKAPPQLLEGGRTPVIQELWWHRGGTVPLAQRVLS